MLGSGSPGPSLPSGDRLPRAEAEEENLTMTLISELIDVPLVVNEGDFVLKLTRRCRRRTHRADDPGSRRHRWSPHRVPDAALGLIGSAVANNEVRAAYLHGSFGSGDRTSWPSCTCYSVATITHEARLSSMPPGRGTKNLDGKTFLQVPLHFLTATSMEAAILGGYVRHVRDEHPDAPLPAVFLADAVLEKSLPVTRTDLGDEHFVAGLNEAAGGDGTWGEFGDSWTIDRVDAADRMQRGRTDSARCGVQPALQPRCGRRCAERR